MTDDEIRKIYREERSGSPLLFGRAVAAQARAELIAEMKPVAWTEPRHRTFCSVFDPAESHCDCDARGEPLAIIPKE